MNKPINCAWVVDDDPLQVLVLNRMLTTNQSVKTAKFFSGAKAALETMAANKSKSGELPDVIFLDLIMTRGDGWEFLDQYKKIKSKLSLPAKIVVISSYNEENYKKLKQYPEVTRFLAKPIDKKQFEDLIEELISDQKMS